MTILFIFLIERKKNKLCLLTLTNLPNKLHLDAFHNHGNIYFDFVTNKDIKNMLKVLRSLMFHRHIKTTNKLTRFIDKMSSVSDTLSDLQWHDQPEICVCLPTNCYFHVWQYYVLRPLNLTAVIQGCRHPPAHTNTVECWTPSSSFPSLSLLEIALLSEESVPPDSLNSST